MKFASYITLGTASYGLLQHNGDILDLPKASPGLPVDLAGFIAAGEPALEAARAAQAAMPIAAIVTAASLTITAPIPRPAKNVFCVGRNYRDHVAEGYRAAGKETKYPDYPQFFSKPPTAVIGPNEPFYHDPKVTQRLDYEVELALIIGPAGKNITREDAWKHVFGITILNDITGRDLQRRHEQWLKGKGLDRSCPMGPYILHMSAVENFDAIELSITVDGEERQHSNLGQLIFNVPEIIAQLSSGLTLEPGDIIATGTPSGVGYAMDPPRYLLPGMVVTCKIDGLGELTTPILAEPV
jgi:2-keto-4-pentenoate hydratase/2-oxohepta-3-ene-1,7-dioic acid hydratase in catechol pathway